jgi:hypothetical protein
LTVVSFAPEKVTVGVVFAMVTLLDCKAPIRPGASVGVASAITRSPLLGLMLAGAPVPVQLLVG